MIPQWLIERKRDGHELTPAEIHDLIEAYAAGRVYDSQMAAFAMAVFFQGMTFDETTALADAMLRSGDALDLSDLDRPAAGKLSTGGVGDKVSLILAPLAASAGLAVPMLSGRGIGITGGTLDKLEAIPGCRTHLDPTEIIRMTRETGCVIAGHTERIAPVERKFSALRDLTATFPSIPLLAAGIMSRKMAEGVRHLVIDIKVGEGAFMRDMDQARHLAGTLLAVGRRMGRHMSAMLTNMNRPLGRTIGNALEVREAIEVLRGGGPADVRALSLALVSEMLQLSGLIADHASALQIAAARLDDGSAFEIFRKMVRRQGGDPKTVDHPETLSSAPIVIPVESRRAGFVSAVHAGTLGEICLHLGAGRKRVDDPIHPGVGISELVVPGTKIGLRHPLMRIHAASRSQAESVLNQAHGAIEVSASEASAEALIHETIPSPEMP